MVLRGIPGPLTLRHIHNLRETMDCLQLPSVPRSQGKKPCFPWESQGFHDPFGSETIVFQYETHVHQPSFPTVYQYVSFQAQVFLLNVLWLFIIFSFPILEDQN